MAESCNHKNAASCSTECTSFLYNGTQQSEDSDSSAEKEDVQKSLVEVCKRSSNCSLAENSDTYKMKNNGEVRNKESDNCERPDTDISESNNSCKRKDTEINQHSDKCTGVVTETAESDIDCTGRDTDMTECDGNDSCKELNDTMVSSDNEDNVCRRISFNDTSDDDEDGDTVASRIDLEKISSIKSRMSDKPRKESFEQRLRRRFTIKDAHTSEVTRRVLAVLIKYSLFVFNFVSWITAVVAIALGIWMRTDKSLLVTSDTEFYLDLPLLTCIGGAVTFVVAFLGCVGALRENLILLRVFFYVLVIILVGEMILSTLVFVIYTVPEARDNFLRSQPEKILYSAIERYMDDVEVKAWVDRIQSEFKCCGISHTDEGFRDWQISPYFNCSVSNKSIYRCAVPTSCCIFEKGDRVNIMCGFETTDKPLKDVRDYIFTRGCIIGFGEWLGKYNDFIIISCLSVIIMQFLAVLSAKVMVVRIRKQRSRWRLLQTSSSSSGCTTSRSV